MSIGSAVGGFVGGVVGFIMGGPGGAAYGFMIGVSLGGIIDPIRPDMPSPGQPPLDELDYVKADIGGPVADLLGTFPVRGNIIMEWGNRTVEETETYETGKGGGSSETVVTGYKYYHSWLQALVYGLDPVDELMAVFFGDELVWAGNEVRPATGGEVTITLGGEIYSATASGSFAFHRSYSVVSASADPTFIISGDPWGDIPHLDPTITYENITYIYSEEGAGGGGSRDIVSHSYDSGTDRTTVELSAAVGMTDSPTLTFHIGYTADYIVTRTTPVRGSVTFYFGTADQVAHPTVAEALSNPNQSPAYRGLCYAFFNDVYIGNFNRVPNVKFVIRKTPAMAFNANNVIGTYDINPAHALYYIKEKMVGLPAGFLNDSDYSDAADTLYAEGRGVSLLLDRQEAAMTYIESILSHAGGLITYSGD